jgi:hypothetical protein
VSNEFDIKIDNIDDQYLSINEQVKKKNPGYLFYLVIYNKASSPPSEPMFQSISKLTILHHRFNCLLSIGRVNLSNACSILVA